MIFSVECSLRETLALDARAEGATAPETLRQKDRREIRPLESNPVVTRFTDGGRPLQRFCMR